MEIVAAKLAEAVDDLQRPWLVGNVWDEAGLLPEVLHRLGVVLDDRRAGREPSQERERVGLTILGPDAGRSVDHERVIPAGQVVRFLVGLSSGQKCGAGGVDGVCEALVCLARQHPASVDGSPAL